LNSEHLSPIPARRRWGLVAGFAAAAVFGPLVAHGTEGGSMGWAWFTWFALCALIAATKPDTFL